MDGCNTTFLLGRPIFRGYVTSSFREGKFLSLSSEVTFTTYKLEKSSGPSYRVGWMLCFFFRHPKHSMGLVYLPYKTVGSFGGFHVYVNISYIECLGMMEGLWLLLF